MDTNVERPDNPHTSRQDRYAQAVIALRRDRTQVIAPALFQMAVTNGLLLIYDHHLGAAPGRRLPDAQRVLNALKTVRPPELVSMVDHAVLERGIKATDGVRHGRAGRSPTEDEVEALRDLDEHPALGVLGEAIRDDFWLLAEVRDTEQAVHAESLLDLLDDDEIERRVAYAHEYPQRTYSPKEASGIPDPGECRVCNNYAVVGGYDSISMTLIVGRCMVCGYDQTEEAVFDDAIRWKVENDRD